jgi:L-ascorbate metabolism protein UlaG (beta-lactamase superfamily)
MEVTHYGHSCVLLDTGAARLLIDPGTFSQGFEGLTGLDAVLVTHQHPDHLDPERLPALLRANPGARLIVDPGTAGEVDADHETVEPGATVDVAGARVEVLGGQHAVIHPDIPRITNVAYLVDDGSTNFYHPGDSYVAPEGASVETLFVPLHAPWAKVSETIDFVREVKPNRVFALHDALLKENGAGFYDNLVGGLGGAEYARLAPGTAVA